jgi:hypothetical protein
VAVNGCNILLVLMWVGYGFSKQCIVKTEYKLNPEEMTVEENSFYSVICL